MESFKQFVASSQDQQKQIMGAKRTLQASKAEVFEQLSSERDLYDHLKNHLQVSKLDFNANFL